MNIFKKSVIEIFGYIFFSFVIVCLAAFFFVSSCSAFSDNFDSYSNNQNLDSVNTWIGSTARPNNTIYYSIPNSLDFYSTTGVISRLTDYANQKLNHDEIFYLYIGNTTVSGYDFEYSIKATTTGSIFNLYVDYSSASGTVKLFHGDSKGSIENFEDVTPNQWHKIRIASNRTLQQVTYYIDDIPFTGFETTDNAYYDNYKISYFFKNGPYYVDEIISTIVFKENTSLDNYDFSLSEKDPDFGTVANQICFLGKECRLYFSFNQLAIGYQMYLFNYDDYNFPGNEIGSTTVTATPFWQNYIVVPDQATSTVLKYNFLLDAGDYGWIVKTGISISWWSEEQWQEYVDQISPRIDEYCSTENVCANVATSSDFLYGVQCGFQQGVCWMLVPNSSSKDFFLETVTKFENSFPFNFYFTIINQAKSDLQKEASSTASFDFPMYSTSTGEVSWQPLIDSDTIPDVWTDDSFDFVNNIFTWGWWILIIILITILVYKQLV